MVGEVIAGRYQLEELVGTGGMSSVYRAHDRLLERNVALKILHESHVNDESQVERFRREARAVAQLSHPNLVTVIDRGEEDGRQFIVFEYVEGENLKEYVGRRGALPVREALALVIEVARGLAFAHRQGIVHRDVKPQNVILNGSGKAKVTDFGIARSLEVEKAVTQTGTVLGTSDYIAPEQASGRPVNAQTDVYSLGCVLFELLTGRVPFPGDSFVAVAMRHIHEPVPSVLEHRPDVPLRVANAVERAMAKDPAERFASMDDLVAELEACLAERVEPDAERTMVVPRRVVRESGRRRERARRSAWPLVLMLLGALVLGAVAAAVLVGGGAEEDGGIAAGEAVKLTGVASWDPFGANQEEHPERVADATDGEMGTYWTTESYRAPLSAIGKEGVGIVLDAGKPVELSRIVVRTDTSGYTAEIRAGDSEGGPFERRVSPSRQVGASTTFAIDGDEARYYVVWITELDGVAHVNEVAAG